ncbi:putative membrane protein [Acinetobacter baumannii 83444]|nr:putative membrane protein [Acinetobacter baumannii 83444]
MVVTPPNNLIVLKAAYFKWAVFLFVKIYDSLLFKIMIYLYSISL